MTGTERTTLLAFLAAQRRVIHQIVEGLDEVEMTSAVVPSGWTPVGLVDHLAAAERHWFEGVVAGRSGSARTPSGGAAGALAAYAEQCRRSDEVLGVVALADSPAGPVAADETHLAGDVRRVVLHMIEETARHAGHLDIGRELIDGRTGLGPR